MENLISIQNWTIEAPKNSKARFLAKNRRQIQSQKQSAHYQTITFVGNEFYAVRKELDLSSNPQLFLVKLDMNQLDQLLYKVSSHHRNGIMMIDENPESSVGHFSWRFHSN